MLMSYMCTFSELHSSVWQDKRMKTCCLRVDDEKVDDCIEHEISRFCVGCNCNLQISIVVGFVIICGLFFYFIFL